MSLNRASTHVPVAAAEEIARREATRAAARKMVARHSGGDLDTCRDLLDMLGLRGEAMCTCGEPMSRPAPDGYTRVGGDGLCWQCHDAEKRAREAAAVPSCACGRKLADGEQQCLRCRDYVPAEQVRELVQRIGELTGRGPRRIGEMAGINGLSLSAVCVPSSVSQRVHRDTYDRLLDLEKRWEHLNSTQGEGQ